MGKPLFSNPEILNESIKQVPLEYQEQEVDRITSYIKNQTTKKKPRIITYLAPFGSGKSVILENASKKLKKIGYTTLQFDIWQCSSTEETWKYFLFEVLSKINNKKKKRVLTEIEGKKTNWKILIFFSIAYVIISLAFWFLYRNNKENLFISFIRSFLIYAAPVLITLFGINSLFPINKAKITTLFQYEEKLKKEIRKQKQPLIIIVEDIDRSGDSGERFLETLKCFLNEIKNKSIIVICPQNNSSFGKANINEYDNRHNPTARLEKSIKIYDDVVYGTMPAKITTNQAKQLLKKAECNNKKLISAIDILINLCSDYSIFTMRSLKFMLRNTISFLNTYPNADPAITFFHLSLKFLNGYQGGKIVPLVKCILWSENNTRADIGKPETKLLIKLLNINLKKYEKAKYLNVSYSTLDKKEYKITKNEKNEMVINCEIDVKYKTLLNRASI